MLHTPTCLQIDAANARYQTAHQQWVEMYDTAQQEWETSKVCVCVSCVCVCVRAYMHLCLCLCTHVCVLCGFALILCIFMCRPGRLSMFYAFQGAASFTFLNHLCALCMCVRVCICMCAVKPGARACPGHHQVGITRCSPSNPFLTELYKCVYVCACVCVCRQAWSKSVPRPSSSTKHCKWHAHAHPLPHAHALHPLKAPCPGLQTVLRGSVHGNTR